MDTSSDEEHGAKEIVSALGAQRSSKNDESPQGAAGQNWGSHDAKGKGDGKKKNKSKGKGKKGTPTREEGKPPKGGHFGGKGRGKGGKQWTGKA